MCYAIPAAAERNEILAPFKSTMMVKLFVSGFPLDIEEIELAKLFSLHGDVKTIKPGSRQEDEGL